MRRNPVPGLTALFVVLLLSAACAPADVSIEVSLGEGAEMMALESVEVQLLPYDRDAIFDSLGAAAPRPEPQVPADLVAAQDEVAAARQAWRNADARWNELRDQTRTLVEQLEDLNPAERQYNTLYAEYEQVESELARAEREQEQLFEIFTELQGAIIGRSDSMRIVLQDWEDEAFVDVDMVIAAKVAESGMDAVADTTDTGGFADFQDGVAPGSYWIHARYELPTEELYWNVPVMVTREEPFVLRLSRDNAMVRPIR